MHLTRHSRILAFAMVAAACSNSNDRPAEPTGGDRIVADSGNAAEMAARYAELEQKVLSDARCKVEVDEVLLGARGVGRAHPYASRREWTQIAGGRDGSVTLVSPTVLPGMWTTVRRYMNREIVVERVTARFTTKYTFAIDPTGAGPDACTVTEDTESAVRTFDEDRMARSFTDSDLLALVGKNRRGVIYVWSPHMPYSYARKQGELGAAGIDNVKAAVALLEEQTGKDIEITVAADAAATPELIDSLVAAEPSLTPDMARPVQSMELLYRNVNQHYPALLVYEGGRISRHVYPGVETPEKYASYILGQLEQLAAGEGK